MAIEFAANAPAELVVLANKLTWKNPDLKILKPQYAGQYPLLSMILQEQIERHHARGELMLPDLRAFKNESIAVFSDYSGEGHGNYHTYSVLVCGWNLMNPAHRRVTEIRSQYGLGRKEIAFKDLRMGQLRRALPEYLQALDNLLPGFLFTLSVEKRIISLFGSQEKVTLAGLAKMLKTENLGDRKPEVAEKTIRIVHTVAYLCGLLAHDGQNIFWMTDHDDISANRDIHDKTLALLDRVLGFYARDGYSFPRLGYAVPFDERDTNTLDALSATDLAAGALCQYLTERDKAASVREVHLKEGCNFVLQWLGRNGVALKKMSVLVRLSDEGLVESGTLRFSNTEVAASNTAIPIFDA